MNKVKIIHVNPITTDDYLAYKKCIKNIESEGAKILDSWMTPSVVWPEIGAVVAQLRNGEVAVMTIDFLGGAQIIERLHSKKEYYRCIG